jgi:hypothetical protein
VGFHGRLSPIFVYPKYIAGIGTANGLAVNPHLFKSGLFRFADSFLPNPHAKAYMLLYAPLHFSSYGSAFFIARASALIREQAKSKVWSI